ncbi:hypothetical protein F511_41810 [Dorcoceras hygrometricum]|uniref:Uncharacterized protein n=1 Tax=Dorcoceras hygrometricum TaxID=472368 RepID=A0A2Z7DHL0_9LAMI|nr:hypothetical protein F511_41810 [Dorcoceras hygrometricum]
MHLNGYIEELDHPVRVSELTGKPAQSFLFTQLQLLSPASTPLKPDDVLEPGRVYFLLPLTLFQSNVSPVEFAPIARKLASMARNNRSRSGSREIRVPSCLSGRNPVCTPPMSSPN